MLNHPLLPCFAPFQRAINLGEPLLEAYFSELRRFPAFRQLPFHDFPQLRDQMLSSGWWTRMTQHPDTFMASLNPGWPLHLGTLWAQQLPDVRLRIEKAFCRYYNWMGNNLYQLLTNLDPDNRTDNLDFLALEIPNLFKALDLSIQHRLFDFTQILLPINAWLDARGRHQEWFDLVLRTAARLETLPHHERNTQAWFSLIHLYDTLGAALFRADRFAGAEKWYRKALRTFQYSGQNKVLPQAYRGLYQNLAAVTAARQNWKASDAFYQKLHRTLEKLDDPEGWAAYFLNYGVLIKHQQRFTESSDHLQKAIDAYLHLRQPDAVCLCIYQLGAVNIALDRYLDAETCLLQAKAIAGQLGDQPRLAEIHEEFAKLRLKQTRFGEAADHASAALRIFLTENRQRNAADAYQWLATAAIGLHNIAEAADYFHKALNIYQQLGDQTRLQNLQQLAARVKNYGT